MSITIGSNIASLLAQRQLGVASNSFAQSMQRLSSGMRINNASDDAAGLAISSSLNADRRVFTQALRNLNDGISLLGIAEGAFGEIGRVLVRQEELAEQAANGVYSNRQRQALNQESLALSNEINRILETTSFNGLNLLNGSQTEPVRIQAGYGVEGGIVVDIGTSITAKVGDGTYFYSPQTPYAIGSISGDASLGDFNGDGKLDVAILGGGELGIIAGNGDGWFPTSVRSAMPTSTYSNHLIIGDLNSDGRDDIVAGGSNTNTIILLSNGDGRFKINQSFGNGDSWSNEVFDFDQDGTLDVVQVRGYEPQFYVALGNGDGSFRAVNSYRHGSNSSEGLGVGDLNGDGFLDIIVPGESTNTVGVALGNGDASFKAGTSFFVQGSAVGNVAVSDFNNDGKQDLAVSNQFTGGFSLLVGNGDGSFKAHNFIPHSGDSFHYTALDANGDGNSDLLASKTGSPGLVLRLGNGDGTFAAEQALVSSAGWYSSTPGLGDVNGDSVLDIAYAAPGGNQIFVLLGNGQTVTTSISFSSLDLSTQSTSRSSLDTVATQRQLVTSALAKIGAAQTRLETATRMVQVMEQNYAYAQSRIQDTDVAQEAATALRQSMLKQVATAVLSQANIQPQIALRLLAG